jgi:hypothetical protein
MYKTKQKQTVSVKPSNIDNQTTYKKTNKKYKRKKGWIESNPTSKGFRESSLITYPNIKATKVETNIPTNFQPQGNNTTSKVKPRGKKSLLTVGAILGVGLATKYLSSRRKR